MERIEVRHWRKLIKTHYSRNYELGLVFLLFGVQKSSAACQKIFQAKEGKNKQEEFRFYRPFERIRGCFIKICTNN